MTDRDIMQQALDALRQCEFTSPPAQRQIVKNALAALNERLAQPEQEFIKHHGDDEGWSEWVCPDPKDYLMKCCDCGLVHQAQFRVAKYAPALSEECEIVNDPDLQAQFRMRRSEQWSPEDTAYRPGGLAQPEQQEQWDAIPDAFNEWWNADYDDTGNPYRKDSPAYWAWSGWKAASKQLEQESVAWIYRDSWGTMKLSQVTPPPVGAFPVYTTPPQRKPLTDEQKGSMWMATTIDPCSHKACYLRGIADAEAAHGIKE